VYLSMLISRAEKRGLMDSIFIGYKVIPEDELEEEEKARGGGTGIVTSSERRSSPRAWQPGTCRRWRGRPCHRSLATRSAGSPGGGPVGRRHAGFELASPHLGIPALLVVDAVDAASRPARCSVSKARRWTEFARKGERSSARIRGPDGSDASVGRLARRRSSYSAFSRCRRSGLRI
jgi:hypothetical protein